MAYVSGTANSLAEIMSALQGACVTHGWTLSGDVLHKGSCFAEVKFGGRSAPELQSHISVRPGNGLNGSNALTDFPGGLGCIGYLQAPSGSALVSWDWPVSYHIHVHESPDEVYLFVQYGGAKRFQWLMFGQSPARGNQGSGNWAAASLYIGANLREGNIRFDVDGGTGSNTDQWTPLPFWPRWTTNTTLAAHSYVHGCVAASDGAPIWSSIVSRWSNGGPLATPETNVVNGATAAAPLLRYSPSIWNDQAILLPFQVLQWREEQKTSVVAEMKHMRLTRNDFISDGEIVVLGSERWKIYPGHRKSMEGRNGGVTSGPYDHSGTIALAIRYDGP